jgi:hypothetical protein
MNCARVREREAEPRGVAVGRSPRVRLDKGECGPSIDGILKPRFKQRSLDTQATVLRHHRGTPEARVRSFDFDHSDSDAMVGQESDKCRRSRVRQRIDVHLNIIHAQGRFRCGERPSQDHGGGCDGCCVVRIKPLDERDPAAKIRLRCESAQVKGQHGDEPRESEASLRQRVQSDSSVCHFDACILIRFGEPLNDPASLFVGDAARQTQSNSYGQPRAASAAARDAAADIKRALRQSNCTAPAETLTRADALQWQYSWKDLIHGQNPGS